VTILPHCQRRPFSSPSGSYSGCKTLSGADREKVEKRFTHAVYDLRQFPDFTIDVGANREWLPRHSSRIFSVSAEGSTKLANLDLFAIAGQFTTVERMFSVALADGGLNLTFAALVDSAIVSAIAIIAKP
jgi:Malectin domain